ncbi:hypothetical protein IWQ62_004709, partial [Dispira parvispora]
MSSNFFTVQSISSTAKPAPLAIRGGDHETPEGDHSGHYRHEANLKVVTAPPGSVLLGTIMKLVLKVCEENHIPVEYRHPTLSEARNTEWWGAFITSTSRLVLPIHAIYVREHGENRLYSVPELEMIDFIRDEVQRQLMETTVLIEHPDSTAKLN